jgi:DNA helicase-2/ATP-dependent DNA helicase PcrA
LVEGASFAVIAHTNRELIDIQRSLIVRDIPFRKSDGKSIFDYPEVQTFGSMLKALVRPTANDIDMVLSWTGMTESDCREIRRLFGASIRIGSPKDFDNSSVSEDGRKTWRSFAKRYNEWAQLLQQGFNSLLHMGVHEWLLETLQKPNSEYILQTAADLFDPKDKSLAKHLADLKNAEILSQKEDKAATTADPRNVVWLLTAHGSKGLEYDRVWIVGVQSGSFPSEKSSLEEERRLMFVAMTRAREMLWISATKEKKPSVFVYEARLLKSTRNAA